MPQVTLPAASSKVAKGIGIAAVVLYAASTLLGYIPEGTEGKVTTVITMLLTALAPSAIVRTQGGQQQ